MNVSWCEAVFAKRLDGILESLKLFVSKFLLSFIIGRRQMRHKTVNSNVCESLQRSAEIRNVIGSYTKPPHSGVDFHVNIDSFMGIFGGATKCFDGVEPVHNRRESLLN